ncbi:sigma-70 family RNA polymerase sigma factor [uncultured Thermanaerothrix sp.]|uniref:RNA polymerase sigma factor n=1 Tax=uncultured Thermanaerothrix sp. TaxID=1195149 RepID=UPI00262DBC0D|nr:sigma-70 family RNA polymerase sigma factor [uncultured Thermanaerothrix sp.]
MNETTYIARALEGDLEAFNQLVLTYQDSAYNLAYRMLNDPDAAADVTQIAFIAAYRNLKTYRGGSFRAWVLRMVTNACYDELRRRKRRPTVTLEPFNRDEEEIESPTWLADNHLSPEEAVQMREVEKAITHCLQQLPEDFRAVVIMVDVEGYDYNEVAQILSKPLGTIKSRLARARFRLRDCLAGFAELLPARFRLDKEEMV